MPEIWIMGEMLVEMMRTETGVKLSEEGLFRGPFPSGAPAIFIDVASRLGHQAGIFGAVGDDAFGRNLLDRLTADGVNVEHVNVSPDRLTGIAFVTYFEDGSREFLFHLPDSAAVQVEVPEQGILESCTYFHVMGCSLMASRDFAAAIVKTMNLALTSGAKISFDPNVRKELLGDAEVSEFVGDVLRKTSIFMPGVEELLLLTESETVEEGIKKCFENPAMEMVVLKKGSQGSTVYTREREYSQGIYRVKAVDPTGAGDSYDAAFLCGLLEGKSIEEAMQMASAAGAINTAAFGPMEGRIDHMKIDEMIRLHETGG